jgi:hypothetical protein
MSNLTQWSSAGLIFEAVSVGMTLPMSFPDKTTALLAAFISRFGIGLLAVAGVIGGTIIGGLIHGWSCWPCLERAAASLTAKLPGDTVAQLWPESRIGSREKVVSFCIRY